MSSAGLPDSIGAADLPGNDAASEMFERQWSLYSEEIKQNARDDLQARCIMPGPARSGYLDYCAEHGICSVIDYVAALEQINALEWQRTVALWERAQFHGSDAA